MLAQALLMQSGFRLVAVDQCKSCAAKKGHPLNIIIGSSSCFVISYTHALVVTSASRKRSSIKYKDQQVSYIPKHGILYEESDNAALHILGFTSIQSNIRQALFPLSPQGLRPLFLASAGDDCQRGACPYDTILPHCI